MHSPSGFYLFVFSREYLVQFEGIIEAAGEFRLVGTSESRGPSPCPNLAQQWAQTRLLRASVNWDVKLAGMETAHTPSAPGPLLGCLPCEKASPYLQPKRPMFHLVPLPLALPPYTPVKTLAASPSCPFIPSFP